MGRLVSNSFNLPLPLSISPPNPPLPPPFPNALAELSSIGAQGFTGGLGAFVGEGRAGERAPPGEKDRRPSMGGGERARFVSGD
jgi:hypothetical protein